MKFRWMLKIVLFLIAILCFIVVGIMYTKLSFIDWPYLAGGVIFLVLGVLERFQKNNLKKR